MWNFGVISRVVIVASLVEMSACALEDTAQHPEQQATDDELRDSNVEGAKTDAASLSPDATLQWDGVQPQNSSCWNDRRFVQSTHLFIGGNGQSVSSIIYLYYSPGCRTTWARLTGGTIPEPGNSTGGMAQIIRNFDGRTYTCHVTTSSGECTTAMVNDAGVTSYAFGEEDAGAWTAWARTANF
ncbi:MAG: DUF2690 domain-containing protein [Deltaproteobacteria bacterium]|nr:MAG: DUF2690 domain-containing protein [Deltaproteobacteria bacterium]TMQ16205.1 MAG: DUF2690 domain-containing protein [Deltaproteobacteria bacterium]